MIVSLKNNKFSAKIDSFGAQLISFYDNEKNTEFIWQRKAPYWDMCAPILFPVVGRAVKDTITVDGKDYPMEAHGFAQNFDFNVIENSGSVATFALKHNKETLTMYPYKFTLFVSFILDESGINTEMKVVNTDSKDILFGIGGHPAINWPIFDEDSFNDYYLEFDGDYDITAIGVGDNADILPEPEFKLVLSDRKFHVERRQFVPDAIIIEKSPSDNVKFVNEKGKGIRFEFKNFKTIAFWTEAPPSDAPFLCIEPWNSMGKRTGDTTLLKDKKDIVTLSVGKEFICSYKICPIL